MGTSRPAPSGDIVNWEHDFTARAKKCLMQAGTAIFGKVYVTDGTDDLAVNTGGSINAVCTATDLDIRDLTHVSDSVKVGDGTDFLEWYEHTPKN